jgi:hypothetical protein
MDYDFRNPGRTTLTAYQASVFEAYNLVPGPYATDQMPDVGLSWTPGDYVKLGGLFRSLPQAKFGNGHHVIFSTDATIQTKAIGGLLRGTIGTTSGNLGTQDANSRSIANDFGGKLPLDRPFYWCVIETNDVNAPLTGDPNLSGWIGWSEPALSKWAWRSMWHAFRTLSPAATLVAPTPSGTTVTLGIGAPLKVSLQWNRGYYAGDTLGHDIYFGTNFNDVNTASIGSDPNGTYKGRRTETTYDADVMLGKTYYWRIDEVNAAGPAPGLWKGYTWNFIVGNWRAIDEFDYANDANFRAAWKQLGGNVDANSYVDFDCGTGYGSGALISRAGSAMQYDYDNNDKPAAEGGVQGLDYFSEARRVFTSPQHWTYGDPCTTLRALVIAFRGNPNNQADPVYDRMYCMVEDSAGNIAHVYEDLSQAQKAAGSDEFNISLADINEAGVNEKSVSAIYLGFGVRCNPNGGTPGGEGRVFFDSIRAYPPRCVGEPNFRMLGDLAGTAAGSSPSNCSVDFADVKTMVNAWLAKDGVSGHPIAVAGNDPCMLVRYEFETGWTNDANGRVGHNADGNEVNTPHWGVADPAGQRSGKVAYFDQSDANDMVTLGTWGQDGNFAGKSFTIAFWANQEAGGPDSTGWADMVGKGETYQKVELLTGSPPQLVHAVSHSSGVIVSATRIQLGTWYHIAETFEQFPGMPGGMQRLFINGKLDGTIDTGSGQNDINEIPYDQTRHAVQWCDPNWTLGAQQEEGNAVSSPPTPWFLDRPFRGYLDDVRVYDRRLQEGEVMWLAGHTDPSYYNYYAIPSPGNLADIYSPEALGSKRVNAKDLAVLAQDWLKSQLWP